MRFGWKILKKIVFNAFLLYCYNLIAVNFNMVIPINFFTLFVTSILGIPSLLGLLLFKFLIL